MLEVVREERVEDWVGTGVDVGEDHQGEVGYEGDLCLWDGEELVDDVEREERQPAEYKHQHDDHHHACHLAL